jgi:hypothetical protein
MVIGSVFLVGNEPNDPRLPELLTLDLGPWTCSYHLLFTIHCFTIHDLPFPFSLLEFGHGCMNADIFHWEMLRVI